MFFFFVIVCTVFCIAPLEVMAGWFSWPPLEVGVRYRARSDCLGMRGAFDVLYGVYFIVLSFVNISLTASIAANYESQILVGKYLIAAVKKYIKCVIMYSAVM